MRRSAIGIEDAVLLDNKLWFVLSDYKSLVSMDIETKETKSYTIPSSGAYTQKRAFGSMALVGRKIYLIPFSERTLLQFDVDSEKFVEVRIANRIIEKSSLLFMGVGIYQNYLFVMGVFVPVILRVNTENNQIDYIVDWQKDVEKLIFDSEEAYFRKQSVIIDDKLYVPFCNANAVLEIDCNTMNTIIHKLGEEKQGYSGVCTDGKLLWFSPRKNGSMKKWNLRTNQVGSIEIAGTKAMEGMLLYGGVILFDKKVLLLPTAKRKTLSVEAENVTELEGSFSVVQDNEKNIIIYERNSGTFTLFDKGVNSQTHIKVAKVDIDVEKVLFESNNFISESVILDIKQFVEFVREKE